MQKQNLLNQTFNYWTVLEEDIEKTQLTHRSYWICKCKCGTIKSIRGSALVNGQSKSCGCINKMKHKNIEGQTFGLLTAIKSTNERVGGAVVWECQCQCGNIYNVPVNRLTSGNTKSCGCIKYQQNNSIDYSNFENEHIKVVKRVNIKDKFGRSIWECQCKKCNNIFYCPGSNLKLTQSCGCLKSKGEEKISQILKENNIEFEQQKTFDTCRFPDTNALARFDFYLPKQNILIEYDGSQHFYDKGWESLEVIQYRDNYKNQWCKENNIPLIRIPYTQFDNLSLDMLIGVD